jgi:hypothetical protein
MPTAGQDSEDCDERGGRRGAAGAVVCFACQQAHSLTVGGDELAGDADGMGIGGRGDNAVLARFIATHQAQRPAQPVLGKV